MTLLGGPRDGETFSVPAQASGGPPQLYREPVYAGATLTGDDSGIDEINYRLVRRGDQWVYLHPDHPSYGAYRIGDCTAFVPVRAFATHPSNLGDIVSTTRDGVIYSSVLWVSPQLGSADEVSPDTSQPYFLDLINRIDEITG